jgi:adenylate cyclase
VDTLFDNQGVAVLGMDVVFAEPDDSSGLKRLQQLAREDLRGDTAFVERIQQLTPELDYDQRFAQALKGRPVVMGYYLTSDRGGQASGALPEPVLVKADLLGKPITFTGWSGYGSNLPALAHFAPKAGFFNSITDGDGVVRSVPLLAEYKDAYYESLSLAVIRVLLGGPSVAPGFPAERFLLRNYQGLESIQLKKDGKTMAVPVDARVATLVPFKGRGGPNGGGFKYVSAADVLAKRLPAGMLKDRIVLLGTTAPGLLDLRVTPVSEAYPGVEIHANLISGMLDGRMLVTPDYALGYEVLCLVVGGLLLAMTLPLLNATRAVVLSVAVIMLLLGLNFWLYLSQGLVMPIGSQLFMAIAAFALNMSFGYFVESRSKRELARLFGTYVPAELVDEMVKNPDSYSMAAQNKELTVMFCDMRGFTKLSEKMEPTQLQALLNAVFSRLTDQIRINRGTIDKYMGDCVMAFWGAPVETPNHAALAVRTALRMVEAIHAINEEHRASGLPEIGIGIGLNTGAMCVGDMGSNDRRAYTVIGDAVNLGSRLEGLSKTYGVEIVVSEATRKQAGEFFWQELDRVRVKGKEQAVAIFTPRQAQDTDGLQTELKAWGQFLKAYRNQDWDGAELHLFNLQRMYPGRYLHEVYEQRVQAHKLLPLDPAWDGATTFETK